MNLLNNIRSYGLKFKNIIKFFLGVPLTIISFYFIFTIVLKSKDAVLTHITHANVPLLIVGMLFLILFFFLKGVVWNKIMQNLGYKIPLLQSLYFYSFSETKRYIPGSIFSFVSRIKSSEHLKVPSKVILKSIGIEIALLVLSSIFISIPGIIFCFQVGELYLVRNFSLNDPLFNSLNLYGFFLLFGLFIICYAIFHIAKKLSITKKHIGSHIDIFLLSALSWFFFGVGNYCIVASMAYLEPYFFLQYVSFFAFSWLVGYLSFITPMGLGVREGVMSFGLSTIGGIAVALSSALSIIVRIVLIFTEIIFLLLLKVALSLKIKSPFKLSYEVIILISAIFSYIAYFSYVTFEKHMNFFTGRFDLGNMDQTVWNTINGRIFLLTNPDSTNITSRLGTHADFILIILSPFYLIWQDPRMLLFIQTAILAFGSVFVYLIAQYVIRNKHISLVFAISYLLCPLVQRQNLYDFHAVTLATTFLIGAFYFLLKKSSIWFYIFLILSVLTKENVYLIASLFGIYCFLNKRKIEGTILFMSGITIFYLLVSKFIPSSRGGEHFALSYFGDFGDSTASVAKNILLKPQITFPIIFSFPTFEYFIKLCTSTGFLSLFSPFYMLFASQDIVVNLLSKNANLRSINFQYTATIIPFIYISSIYGAQRILSFRFKHITKKTIFYYILFFAIISTWIYGVFPGSQYPSLEVFNKTTPDREFINEYLRNIPSQLSVAATNNIGAHLSHREKVYTIPNGLETADVIVFLLNDEFAQPSLKEQRIMVEGIKLNSHYVLSVNRGDFVVFQKK